MEESGEFGEGGAEQGGRGTFCAGDESARGTDEEQMRRWHRGAGGGGQRGQQLRPRRRPDFLGAPHGSELQHPRSVSYTQHRAADTFASVLPAI